MGFHCHQPVGNFDSVLREGCRVCYGPLMEELSLHPGFRFSLHMSGHLLEWIAQREKGIFDLISRMAAGRQAEILTAGFYEPILTVIPPEDALQQIALLSDLAEGMAGLRPIGLWLTERIWDPSLIPLLGEAGVQYTVVDDNHLIASGHGDGDLTGYFVTESRGQMMALYPISQNLRYATPFKQVPEAIDAIHGAASGRGRTAIVFDDGEKFGMWPGTADWVYGRGWLRDFLTAVTEREDIVTRTFRDHFEGNRPMGSLRLPPGSYIEMEEWTLPPRDARVFHELYRDLEQSGRGEEARRFLRGGLWQDFLSKYSESNNMHKKMIHISRRTRDRKVQGAEKALFQGQCNDAYWHGIFGGLYLPVLRNGVKRALNEAERILDEEGGVPDPLLSDINADGYQEVDFRSRSVIAVVTERGGHLYELSDKESLFDLLSTLTRRLEHYHLAAQEASQDDDKGDVATIHESVRTLGEEVRELLVYDRYPRYAFVDHVLPPGTGVREMVSSTAPQWGDFAEGLYGLTIQGNGARAVREGRVFPQGGESSFPMTVRKDFRLEGRTLTADYALSAGPGPSREVLFCSEINLHLPTGTGARGEVDGRPVPLDAPHEETAGTQVTLSDPVLPELLTLKASVPGDVWCYPVYTVSQSESGFEVTYQATCVCFAWKLDFSREKQLSLKLTLSV